MNPNHILSPGERRKLRANLPPTPLPVEIQTPSVLPGPYPSAARIGNDQFLDIPLRRRLFSPGRYQDRQECAVPEPHVKDYFSLPPRAEENVGMQQPIASVHGPAVQPAESKEEKREDKTSVTSSRTKVRAMRREDPPAMWLFWKLLLWAEWAAGAIIFTFVLKFALPFLVLGIIVVAVIIVGSKIQEFVQNRVRNAFRGGVYQTPDAYSYRDSFADVADRIAGGCHKVEDSDDEIFEDCGRETL
ncbi:hypothetical protein K440DRAFT_638987 [Wilcoxina mikolae CBS 423.85]|nr:hypothetical protein K440DRAFT_638987 [Wilcoxina mikolae CBS 423.85]